MTKWHEIGELDRTGIAFVPTAQERRRLAQVSDRLGVEWQADGSTRVYSKGWIGTVTLSSETGVRVTTKIPVANILTLASLAYRTLLLPSAVGDTLVDSAEPVVDWLAVLIITEIRALIAHGLRQGYVVIEDHLPYIRGRLRFGTTSALTRPGVMPCEFADFLPDTPENRVLRATLEHLTTQRLLPGLRIQAEQLLRRFQYVSFVRPSSRLLNACVVTRLNQHYKSALELCGLYLNQTGIELNVGSVGAPAYFFPMEMVFQEAVTAFLNSRMPGVRRQTGGSYKPVAGQPVRQLTFAADIVIGTPPQLVIDTKYSPAQVRNQFGGWSFHNSHVYQVVFYGLSLQCPAVLVYPRADEAVDVSYNVEDVAVSIVAVDLEEQGLPGLVALAERVQELIPTQAVA